MVLLCGFPSRRFPFPQACNRIRRVPVCEYRDSGRKPGGGRYGLQNRSGWSSLGLGKEADILLKTKMSLSSPGLGLPTF